MANPNWVEGVSGNPSGRPKGYQSAALRAAILLDGLTRTELIEKLKDTTLSVRDEIIYQNALNALDESSKEFAALERERLFDRTDGKPKQALTGGDEGDKELFPSALEIILKTDK